MTAEEGGNSKQQPREQEKRRFVSCFEKRKDVLKPFEMGFERRTCEEDSLTGGVVIWTSSPSAPLTTSPSTRRSTSLCVAQGTFMKHSASFRKIHYSWMHEAQN
jgi:hypothetical protein